MTYRRPSVAVALALVLAAGLAGAQAPAPRDARAGDARPGWDSGQGGRQMRRMPPGRALLRGVTLTTAQRDQIRAIDEKYRAEGRALRDAMRPAADEARSARQRGDTAAARQAWARTADQRRQFTALRERRVAEVRRVLTAEQQRQFDANRSELQARAEERRGDGPARGRGGPRHARGRQG